MKYKRFEELPVWKASIEFAVDTFDFTRRAKSEFQDLGDLKNQLERAAVSVSNNIAEGFERGTTAELIQYLYIARGSSGECRSITYILGSLARFKTSKKDILGLRNASESINRQLYGWINSLKNTDIKGEKFLTERQKETYRAKKDLAEFDREMEDFRKNFAEKLKREEAERFALRTADKKRNEG
ncbi:MAG: four helix bundle protein [Pyrinomonadaceae bacterium]|nr:four helix bundle protein [Pyrinomonadaceae bacterium]